MVDNRRAPPHPLLPMKTDESSVSTPTSMTHSKPAGLVKAGRWSSLLRTGSQGSHSQVLPPDTCRTGLSTSRAGLSNENPGLSSEEHELFVHKGHILAGSVKHLISRSSRPSDLRASDKTALGVCGATYPLARDAAALLPGNRGAETRLQWLHRKITTKAK